MIPTENPTQTLPQPLSIHPNPSNPVMDQRDTLKTLSPTVRLPCEQFLVCPGVTAGGAVAAQMSLMVNLHLLDAPGTQLREHQQ